MSDDLHERLLGSASRDAGCETCFELADRYAEALVRGDDVSKLFPEIVAHLAGCAACREDTEGVIAALRRQAPPTEPG